MSYTHMLYFSRLPEIYKHTLKSTPSYLMDANSINTQSTQIMIDLM